MTAFQAPIFFSPTDAREWVYEQSLDENMYLCRVRHESKGETFTLYEFHNDEDLRFITKGRPSIREWEILESWC